MPSCRRECIAASLALLLGADAYLPAQRAGPAAPRGSSSVRMFGPGAAAAGERIVVTGVGVVSALGNGDDFWKGLVGGKSGIDTIQGFDASKFPTTIGAECLDFEASCPTATAAPPRSALPPMPPSLPEAPLLSHPASPPPPSSPPSPPPSPSPPP